MQNKLENFGIAFANAEQQKLFMAKRSEVEAASLVVV